MVSQNSRGKTKKKAIFPFKSKKDFWVNMDLHAAKITKKKPGMSKGRFFPSHRFYSNYTGAMLIILIK